MRVATPLPQRLFANRKVDDRGCWVWTGSLDHDGYGRIGVSGKMRIAHRVAYETLKGAIPPGLTIDHLCRNRACFNPAHLEPVTLQENIRRGQKRVPKSHCIHGHLYDEANTSIQRDGRRCRICYRMRARLARIRRAS